MTDLITKFRERSDLHQSPMHAELMRLIGWQAINHKGSQLFLRPLGPVAVAKIQRPSTIDLIWLNQLRKKHRILTLYVEPGLSTKPDQPLGWSVEPFAHSATSLIDLTHSPRQLLAGFSQKTRYNITRSLKKNALTLSSTPVNQLSTQEKADFFALRTSWSQAKHVVGYSEALLQAILESYKDHATLHTAYQGSECLASLLTLEHDRVETYYAAFSTPSGHSHFAPTLLTWTALQTAKKSGCDIFDFGGIYDPRYPKMYKKWQGFTKFKEGFRPTTVTYPPTYLKLFW